jgi:DNA-binding CsgD family transcriptional regulator
VLTNRQIELLQAIVDGKTPRQWAEDQGLTYFAAKEHMTQIREKLEVTSTLLAVVWAITNQKVQVHGHYYVPSPSWRNH